MKILVLGAGKMVNSLIEGLRPDEHEYYFYSPSGFSAQELAKKHNGQAVDRNLISSPDLILLGHKPQQLPLVAKELNNRFENVPFVSMLAALDEQTQLNILGAKKLVRIMPNLNVRLKKGVTLISSNSFSSIEINHVMKWLLPSGLCLEVNESQLDELTLLTGCGPALFYQFAVYLTQCFNSMPLKDSLKLTEYVMKGSSELLDHYDGDFLSAIKDVASKGGVTEAILQNWDSGQLKSELLKGIDAGKKRAETIKGSLLRN